jgi:phosphopantothenoylcysteine synthetase/decarboxylase
VQFIGPEEGDLACGYEGMGRLSSVEKITGMVLKEVGLDPSHKS